jgi:hypothetical protein
MELKKAVKAHKGFRAIQEDVCLLVLFGLDFTVYSVRTV